MGNVAMEEEPSEGSNRYGVRSLFCMTPMFPISQPHFNALLLCFFRETDLRARGLLLSFLHPLMELKKCPVNVRREKIRRKENLDFASSKMNLIKS